MAQVLVADDARFMRRVIKGYLVGEGHAVQEAPNGVQALEMLESERPDLLLLDLVMPGLDGFGVLEALRERSERPPVIVMTADIQTSVRERVLGLGALAFLNKPPQKEVLLAAVREALAGAVAS